MKMRYKLLFFLWTSGSIASCQNVKSITVTGKYGTYTVTPHPTYSATVEPVK